MKISYTIVRVLEAAIRHDDEKVKAYARRLSTEYRNAGYNSLADSILAAIGDLTLANATMDNAT
ncbi:MAG: hypothetical protein J6I84_04315 [Bacilli bacterium]|nr:hypothetical protein [Bacilli bacterium]